MTTRTYVVAYPHPSLRPRQRACRCKVDLQTGPDDLRSQLYEGYPDHTEDLKRATFWKSDGLKMADLETKSMQKAYDWIRGKDEDAELGKGYPIVEFFPDGPHDPSQKLIDIVVTTTAIDESVEGDVLGELKYIRARRGYSMAVKRGPSPSDSVKSASAVKEATIDLRGPRYGRPSYRFGPPTSLFSEPLALLEYNLGHLGSFSPNHGTLNRAFDLITSSTDFFGDEDKREATLKLILGGLLPGMNKWQRPTPGKTAQPYGIWLEEPFAYLIVELKNEPGLGGDPFLQALVSYGKLLVQDEYNPYLDRSCFPMILLAIAGNRLVISTAIFTDAIYADELLSVSLRLGPHGPDNVLHVARVFMAINQSMGLLRELYRLMRNPPDPTTTVNSPWPSPTPDPPGSTVPFPSLEYFCKVNRADGTELYIIDEDNERHAMYLARMDTGNSTEVVLVKFATKYHEKAHHLLAGNNLAPTLHFCTRVVGGMYMVVMEYIPASKGQSLYASPPPSPSALEAIRQGVGQALDLLHKEGLVFGDLREGNMLYLPEGEGRVLLVDFDGVGQDGKDRYSASLNPDTELGVVRWQIMEKVHDLNNLEQLMKRLSRRASKT